MNLLQHLEIEEKSFITMIGGGGKTTGLFLLGKLLEDSVITTSTKMFKPPIDPKIPFIYSKREGDKYYGLSVVELERLKLDSTYSHILCEGDGARMKPLKVWKEGEPVIPPSTTHTIINIGGKVLGKHWGTEWVHRNELLPFHERIIDFRLLLDMAELGVFNLPYPQKSKVFLVINQWDMVDKESRKKGEEFAKQFKTTVSFIDKVLFVSYGQNMVYQSI